MELLHSKLGGGRVEALVTYDAITITAFAGGRTCTRIDASREPAGVNIRGQATIRRLLLNNDLAMWDMPMVRARLDEIASVPDFTPTFPWRWLAAGGASAGFCAFNGGDTAAMVIAIVASLVVFAARFELLRKRFTVYLATLGSVFLGGVVAAVATRQGWSATPEVALVSPVLFLVPGAPLITGGFDLTRNHNSMGLARIAYTLALTATIALGLGLAIPLIVDLSTIASSTAPLTWPRIMEDTAWGAVTGAGLALLNNAYWRSIGICALGGATARLLRESGVELGLDNTSATFFAAIVTTLLAYWLGERRRLPYVLLAVMGCLTLIPGYYAINGVKGLFRLANYGTGMPWPEAVQGLQSLLQAVFISFAIIAGIIFTLMVVDRDRRRV